jgi:NAD(P)-dependent dehydrogenase (short-subunit alcohol dehydrogenase family)
MSHKVVLITGADGALGRAVVQSFLKANYKVMATHLTAAKPENTARVEWVQVDLSNPKSVKQILGPLAPQVDVVVHCAGGFRFAPVASFEDQDFDFLINANIKSSFYLAREIIPAMKKRNFGRMIFVSANATRGATAGMGPYAASKAAINLLVEALAQEIKSFNINVNAVLPTIIDTPANRKEMPEADFSKWVSPHALAEIILSLAESSGDPINGALIPVAGRI